MKWLTVDPGETVGWALWRNDERVDAGQTPIWEFADMLYDALIGSPDPDAPADFRGLSRVVVEDWAIYPPGVGPGPPPAWDKCLTARLIGDIQGTCRRAGVETYWQPASIKAQAKAAGAEDLFITPLHENRHANDAVMHGCYHIVMNAPLFQHRVCRVLDNPHGR